MWVYCMHTYIMHVIQKQNIHNNVLYLYNRKKIVAFHFKPGEILAVQCNYFIIPQNVLQMNVTNNNYIDPNNLRFEEIKILGLPQEPVSVTVLQNNNVQNSSHNITYNPVDKVNNNRKTEMKNLWRCTACILYIEKESMQTPQHMRCILLKSTITLFTLIIMLIMLITLVTLKRVDHHFALRHCIRSKVCFRIYLCRYIQFIRGGTTLGF